jgi:hypothetical protein
MYRAYVILWDRDKDKIYIALSKKGQPVLFGGGAEGKDKGRGENTAARELMEESGLRFQTQPKDLVLFYEDKDTSGDKMYFYYTNQFKDHGSCQATSKETSACIELNLTSLYNKFSPMMDSAQIVSEFIKFLRDWVQYMNPTLTKGSELPTGTKIQALEFATPNWVSRKAFFKFIKEYGVKQALTISSSEAAAANAGSGADY